MPEINYTENLNNREFAQRLEQRTKKFAVSILRLAAGLEERKKDKGKKIKRNVNNECG